MLTRTATAAEDAYRPEFKPKFDADGDWFTVTLRNMLRTEFGGEKVPEKPSRFQQVPESSRKPADQASGIERKALEFLQERGLARSSEIAEAVGMTQRGANKMLRRLVESGLIERTGVSRATRYRIREY